MDVLGSSRRFSKKPKRLTKDLYSSGAKSKATVREGETKTSFLPRPLAPEVLLGCSCGTHVRVMYSSSHQPRDFLSQTPFQIMLSFSQRRPSLPPRPRNTTTLRLKTSSPANYLWILLNHRKKSKVDSKLSIYAIYVAQISRKLELNQQRARIFHSGVEIP